MTFDIRKHVEFDSRGRARCPSCLSDGKTKKNLAIIPDTDGAYKCHRGCSTNMIREALGSPKQKQVPQALAEPAKRITSTPKQVTQAFDRLTPKARQWLNNRGLDDDTISRYKLGLQFCRIGKLRKEAITIPIPANPDKTAYYMKKRVCPWDKETTELEDYQPWKQYGIPPTVYFTHKPAEAKTTWLCEGEWDAIMMGQLVHRAAQDIAVCTFTCGASSVPHHEQLDRLPGQVVIFYDRNDKPLKNGKIPGDEGARKAAEKIGSRAKIALVPWPEGCNRNGWDVSNAINHGFTFEDFDQAAEAANPPERQPQSKNSLKAQLVWNDELIDRAPDYTEFLVPDLLTEDELFLLAAGPRTGKSLMAMTLALAVASGGEFMGRPCTQGTVLYVKCEDSDAKIKEREQAQGWGRGLPVAWLDDFKLSKIDELIELVDELDPRLVVLDTLSRIRDGNISESSSEMSQLLEPLQKMANQYGTCVILVHHTGKVSTENAAKIDIFDTIRGSSAIRAVCRGSMVLAAGERDYRLVVENGWGKHDLKVVLDANTLTWKQLGKWSPVANQSQQEQIIETLKRIGNGSVEQLHEETGIPKKSLYQQLSRLLNIDTPAGSKVVKEGSRRKYTYRLALFNTSQQLNSVLNSPNPDDESDRDYSQQNLLFSEGRGEFQQNSVPVEVYHQTPNLPPPTSTESVDYNPYTPEPEGDSTIQHLVNTYSTAQTNGRDFIPQESSSDLSSTVPVDLTTQNSTGKKAAISVGSKVRYIGSKATMQRVCGRKHLVVKAIENDSITVRHADWLVDQVVVSDDLKVIG